ncbi:Structural maintenance of chromosomes protein 5 [Mactra antiquata]
MNRYRKCVVSIREKVQLTLRLAQSVREYNKLEIHIREQSHLKQQAEVKVNELKQKCIEWKADCRKLLALAHKSTGTNPNEDLPQSFLTEFEPLPSSLEELDDKIHEYQVRADSTVQTDETVVEEYRQREEEIADLENKIQRKEQEKDNHQATIEEAKQLWLEPIKDLIGRINESFRYFFSCLNCVGEVDLKIPENPEDYHKYGIRIKVKFRDAEQLKELSPFHQSGGERSVTTVLYMLALQELVTCPFRCVDEINQGMDPINERKVFELVVNTVCQKSTSQYFLLTPKLLPDLSYARNMQILCINNGPFMLSHKQWNLRKIIKNRAKIED